uniref:Uncharacterized protein n=1 Tax=Romanomermis culicivorax TaxID=13658 RepID=A0A915K2J9_ROMCU
MMNVAMQWVVRLLWSFFVSRIIPLHGARGQFNIYGVNIELVKMRLIRQPFYVQEYQLQVDYTHRNRVIDYGVVTVGGVQDQTDYIFVESINRNPFHLPKVEIQGDVCFRLFVQSGNVLFDECTQIRDLPGGSPYYNSKYVTRTKNDGSLLMYKYIQFMMENRDENRALLEQSFVNSQLNSLLGHCSCTTSIVIASLEGAVILIATLSTFYFCRFYEKRSKKSSIKKVAISSPMNGIYADNAVTATSIAWVYSGRLQYSDLSPSSRLSPANNPEPAISSSNNFGMNPTSRLSRARDDREHGLKSELEWCGCNKFSGTYYASNPVDGNANCQTSGTIPTQNLVLENLGVDKLTINSSKEKKEDEAPRFKLPPQINQKDLKTKTSKSIIDQIMVTNANKKKISATKSNVESSIKTNKNIVIKNNSRTKNKERKKIPPDPPPPDYKNDGFEDDEDFYNESKDERKSRDRIYDRLESPNVNSSLNLMSI